jgi:pyrroline-5-carboxylate reductase
VGLLALEQHGFRGAAMECVLKTFEKNKELGEQ